MRKKAAILVMLAIISNLLCGCYDYQETDRIAYVIAVGVDKGKTNSIRITFQLAIPKNIGGGQGGSGGGGGEETFSIVVVEAPSLYAGMNIAEAFLSRQVNLSHNKVIVFSKELAEGGLEKYINAMYRSREFRLNMHIVISRTSAEEFIRSVKPKAEANPAKYYEFAMERYKYNGFAADTDFYGFYNQVRYYSGQPYATLAGVNNNKSSDDINIKGSTYKEKGRTTPLERDFMAGDTSTVGNIKAEMMGLAVFNGAKMVGELDGEETAFHLMSTGKYNYAYFTLPDPESEGSYVVLSIKQGRKPSIKGELVDDMPRVTIKLSLEADIQAIQSSINYEDVNKTPILEKSAEKYIKEGVTRFLEKTRDEFKSDICGFGDRFRNKFLTWKEWVDFGWLNRYKDTSFEIQVDVKVRRPGLMVYTVKEVGASESGEGQE